MSFRSLSYLAFVAVIFVAYYVLPRRAQNTVLLIASYVFYGFWDYRFLVLLLIITILGFYVGRAIAVASGATRRRVWLSVGVIGNLGILAFFKYFNFFVENVQKLAALLGLHASLSTLIFLLPVGISFYVFHAISYIVDVYRGDAQPASNLLDFALYIAYFPKIVAGPIERASHFLPQIAAPRTLTAENVRAGLVLIIMGLFKKVAIADPLSVFVDPLFLHPERFSSPELLRGVLFFSLQIYCDFSGYTDIARGVSRLFGIALVENFRRPYFSVNVTQFWRHWHMSLSSWLRDYVYIPLGGNRRGRFRIYVNLMVTMLVGGLWHGAGWNFVIWGGLHGVCLSVHKMLVSAKKPLDCPQPQTLRKSVFAFASAVITFAFVAFAWIFFRAPGTKVAFAYVGELLSFRGLDHLPSLLPSIVVPWIPVLALDWCLYRQGEETFLLRWPPLSRGVAYGLMVVAIVLGWSIRAPFIYQQF